MQTKLWFLILVFRHQTKPFRKYFGKGEKWQLEAFKAHAMRVTMYGYEWIGHNLHLIVLQGESVWTITSSPAPWWERHSARKLTSFNHSGIVFVHLNQLGKNTQTVYQTSQNYRLSICKPTYECWCWCCKLYYIFLTRQWRIAQLTHSLKYHERWAMNNIHRNKWLNSIFHRERERVRASTHTWH